MFTHLLPESEDIMRVIFSDYSKSHFLSKFQKKYKSKWELTEISIREDLARLRMPNNTTQRGQQIDELWHSGNYWVAKYDFRVAGTQFSTKNSGNRCILHIDISKALCTILYIYNKNDLPNRINETQHIKQIIKENFPEYLANFE